MTLPAARLSSVTADRGTLANAAVDCSTELLNAAKVAKSAMSDDSVMLANRSWKTTLKVGDENGGDCGGGGGGGRGGSGEGGGGLHVPVRTQDAGGGEGGDGGDGGGGAGGSGMSSRGAAVPPRSAVLCEARYPD